ncbi:MAG: hypothetical protein ACOYMG_15040 [Candidatus Methylumidiphilus sp.]
MGQQTTHLEASLAISRIGMFNCAGFIGFPRRQARLDPKPCVDPRQLPKGSSGNAAPTLNSPLRRLKTAPTKMGARQLFKRRGFLAGTG